MSDHKRNSEIACIFSSFEMGSLTRLWRTPHQICRVFFFASPPRTSRNQALGLNRSCLPHSLLQFPESKHCHQLISAALALSTMTGSLPHSWQKNLSYNNSPSTSKPLSLNGSDTRRKHGASQTLLRKLHCSELSASSAQTGIAPASPPRCQVCRVGAKWFAG